MGFEISQRCPQHCPRKPSGLFPTVRIWLVQPRNWGTLEKEHQISHEQQGSGCGVWQYQMSMPGATRHNPGASERRIQITLGTNLSTKACSCYGAVLYERRLTPKAAVTNQHLEFCHVHRHLDFSSCTYGGYNRQAAKLVGDLIARNQFTPKNRQIS